MFCITDTARTQQNDSDTQKARYSRRRVLWQNLPSNRIQQRPIPRSLRANSVRELRRRHRSGGQTSRARFMGHG